MHTHGNGGKTAMMAQFNSCTEITSYSGNTQIYIFRKKGKKKEELSYRTYPKRQKLLGGGIDHN